MNHYAHCPSIEAQQGDVWQLDPRRTYEQERSNKPKGLWLSVDADWERWRKDEDWGVDDWGSPVPVGLDESRVLRLGSAGDIDAFSAEYADANSFYINWPLVAERYAGMVITPYIWERRLYGGTSWYYAWDCASACIWDLSVVRVLEVARCAPPA